MRSFLLCNTKYKKSKHMSCISCLGVLCRCSTPHLPSTQSLLSFLRPLQTSHLPSKALKEYHIYSHSNQISSASPVLYTVSPLSHWRLLHTQRHPAPSFCIFLLFFRDKFVCFCDYCSTPHHIFRAETTYLATITATNLTPIYHSSPLHVFFLKFHLL